MGVELAFRVIQGLAAASTDVVAGRFVIEELPAERRFSAFLLDDPGFFFGELVVCHGDSLIIGLSFAHRVHNIKTHDSKVS